MNDKFNVSFCQIKNVKTEISPNFCKENELQHSFIVSPKNLEIYLV